MSAVLFPAPLLSVERLSIQFGTQRVVDDVSFALWPGKNSVHCRRVGQR
ncbi:putative phosphonate C-P lyase system protein PhnK [Klebsiella pneumoniae]|nr:putative phosphonate C-P lyase system protein PhnK [Klebsiella pneumoniae]VTM81220.1 putative phosphonate C-P lyase system protein PhnK [Klebsiella pneumoniae]